MLVFTPQSLAFIAVPKTGTTAVEMALKPKADILFTKRFKHMTARRFHRKVAPFLDQAFDLRPACFAVMRDPEEQIRSWFRYRTREQNATKGNDTIGKSFDEFVLAVISDQPPPFAGIGSQFNMLASGRGDILVHHLFAHDPYLTRLQAFLMDRFDQEIFFRQQNVSPVVDAPLDPSVRKRLVAARAMEFDLFARLQDAGGHLQTAVG